MIGSGPGRFASSTRRATSLESNPCRRPSPSLVKWTWTSSRWPPKPTRLSAKIMDYNRFKYEAAQRAKESRRKATSTGIKEMKYRPKIGPGDFETKTRQVARFLGEGHKVKITIMFRGREMSHPELGKRILDQVAETVATVAKVEVGPQARWSQHDHGAGSRSPGPGPQAVGERGAAARRTVRTKRRRSGPKPPLRREVEEPSRLGSRRAAAGARSRTPAGCRAVERSARGQRRLRLHPPDHRGVHRCQR